MAPAKKTSAKKKPGWKSLPEGAIVTESTRAKQTGGWSPVRPVLNKAKCVNCMLCVLYCPESCIPVKDGKREEANLKYCKGCGICAVECPVKAIKMERK